MRKTRNRTADTHADLESHPGNAPLRANEAPRFSSPVRIVFTHYRKRLADIDNLSTKAVLDGLVAANVLANDTPEQVAEVAHRQIKSAAEKTIVTIETLNTTNTKANP